MLVFRQSGRLGNQLFQLAGLKKLAKAGERIFLLGFQDLEEFIEPDGLVVIVNSRSSLRMRLIAKLVWMVIRGPVVVTQFLQEEIVEIQSQCIVTFHPSILGVKLWRYCRESYFQSDQLIDHQFLSQLRLRYSEAASAWFQARELDPATCRFVHIRRGDYVNFPSTDASAVLPKAYYDQGRMLLNSGFRDLLAFIYTSDDEDCIHDLFPDLPGSLIIKENPCLTLAIMTLCGGGVLSASSFSWMAALIGNSDGQPRTYVAPEFWAGFRQQRWFPEGSKTNYFTYLTVPQACPIDTVSSCLSHVESA